MSLSFCLSMIRNIKKNFWLLLSAMAALCLFISPSLSSLILTFAIFAIVTVTVALDLAKPTTIPTRNSKLISTLLTILIAYMGFDIFGTTWTPSSKVAALAVALGTTTHTLLLIVGAVGCIVGAYAMYILACWIVLWPVKLLKERLPVQDKTEIKENLKSNWYFPISAMAYLGLNATFSFEFAIGLLIACMAHLIIASQIKSIPAYIQQHTIWLRVTAFLTAIGIAWSGQHTFYMLRCTSSQLSKLGELLPIYINIPRLLSVIGAVAALFFIFISVLVFYSLLTKIIIKSHIYHDTHKAEYIIYSILVVVSFAFVAFSFPLTNAFYGAECGNDVIYTSDSFGLVNGNAYVFLTHWENDLRQPLFAVFTAPFVGIPFLVGKLFGVSESVQAMLVNMVQIVMLFAANFILAKMMKLNPIKRVCFMVLTSCTYTQLLFTLMMEQYIVAYFWLIFCIYLIAEKQQPERIALWGAGGTLLTSMILLPFMSTKSPIKDFKSWFMDMVKYGLEFVALMLVFCRFDVIFNLMSKISFLSGFTGKTVTFADKIHQYTEFIGNCFIAPNAGVNTTAVDHISWQANPATGINFAGILILILAVISAIWNRDKKSSLLAAGWVGFSVIMLLGLGWGTKENGLILYALYFGWAFLVLLFQLAEKIESKLNIKFLVPVVTIVLVVALLVVNIPAIMEMVNFAITYYPV